MASRDILRLVGHTSLQALRYVVPSNGARVLLKLENENPTGSMKDRMAVAMIEAAEADGRLPAGGSVVEYTGGSTGVSLSLVCAVKRYPLHIVTSDAFSREKLDHMRILGAHLQVVHSDSGRMTEKLTKEMVEAARADRRRHRRVLDRSAAQHRSDCRLSADGGRNLDADRGPDRPLRPERRHCGVASRHRRSASAVRPQGSASRRSNPPSLRCCQADSPALTRSTASALDLSCRCGVRRSSIGSSRSLLKPRRQCHCVSHAKRACLPVCPPAPMWSPRCGLQNTSVRRGPWSPSCATPG